MQPHCKLKITWVQNVLNTLTYQHQSLETQYVVGISCSAPPWSHDWVGAVAPCHYPVPWESITLHMASLGKKSKFKIQSLVSSERGSHLHPHGIKKSLSRTLLNQQLLVVDMGYNLDNWFFLLFLSHPLWVPYKDFCFIISFVALVRIFNLTPSFMDLAHLWAEK